MYSFPDNFLSDQVLEAPCFVSRAILVLEAGERKRDWDIYLAGAFFPVYSSASSYFNHIFIFFF